jgi:hypothetical protein
MEKGARMMRAKGGERGEPARKVKRQEKKRQERKRQERKRQECLASGKCAKEESKVEKPSLLRLLVLVLVLVLVL